MAIYTAITDNGLSFNLKAQTIYQASYKAFDFLLEYPQLSNTGHVTVYGDKSPSFDRTRPFITMTSAGFLRRYKSNPNSNKKSIAKLLALV
jgi:hypothetical protein